MIEAAVIGVGQTKYEAKRRDVSMGGLVRKAIDKAMLAADVDWDAIDAVILGKAPDMFEGVMMPELSLVDAIGANGKPLLRVHTAGSVGGSSSFIAASHVCSGNFDTVLNKEFAYVTGWEVVSSQPSFWMGDLPILFWFPASCP